MDGKTGFGVRQPCWRLYSDNAPTGTIYGWQMLGAGIGMASGAFLGGVLCDLTGDYTLALVCSFVLSLMGTLAILVLPSTTQRQIPEWEQALPPEARADVPSARGEVLTMSRLLTVAIPTYRRAAKLDLQLAWLERNIAGLEAVCEVIVSDNASPDDTPTICRKWHETLTRRGVNCRSSRNEQNIGPLPNIARCIEMATSRFTWVIGDDEIADGTLAWVVARLQANPEFASIVLNFQVVGRAVYKRFFNFPTDQLGDGRMVLSACLRQKYWGLAFMTAQIYRTEYVQAALAAWPEGRTNYDYQIFITAFVGARGQVLVIHDRHVKYVTGDNVYETNKRVALTLYADTLEVFVHLSRVGYSATLCRWLARSHLWRFKHRLIRRALDTNLLFILATIGRIAAYLARLYVTGFRRDVVTDSLTTSRA